VTSRLTLAVLFAACTVLAPRAEAQPPPRIGLLSIGTNPDRPTNWEPFFEELWRLGYVESRRITFERRFARGNAMLVSGMVDDLVRLKVDVIVATGNRENGEARRATSTIPIVMVAVADPVASKLVQSLARPGGNTTGLSLRIPGLSEKWLQLLKEAVPTLTRVGVVVAPQAPDPDALKEMRAVAPRLGLTLRAIEIGRREDIEPAIATLGRGHVGAVVVPQDAITFLHRDHLVAVMAKE
jgi:putative ABC transport system substrate-binding protein